VAVAPIEGLLRLYAATAELRLAPERGTTALAGALAELARLLDVADSSRPAAVVVDDPEPLRVVAFAARQETYDTVIRPIVTALGCACTGGGLASPADERPGGIELRVQQALDARPDVLLVWDDGSAIIRRWHAALDLHWVEARRLPAWAIAEAPARTAHDAPKLVVAHATGAAHADAGPLPARHITAGDDAPLLVALWQQLADIWRERRGAAWLDTGPAPRLRAEALLWAARLLAAHYDVPLALFDLDLGQVAVYIAAGDDARVQRVQLGNSHPLSFATGARGRLPGLAPEALAELVERHLRGIPPVDGDTLDMELVLAAGRRGVLTSMPEDAWLVATGRLAAHVADPLRLGLWLLEAARPRGRGLLLWDDANALSLLAALATHAPQGAEALLADGCIPFGGYLVSEATADWPLPLAEQSDGTAHEPPIAPGAIGRVPLLRARIATGRAVGAAVLETVGGPVGLLVDRRSRDREATLRDFTGWVAALRQAAPARAIWPRSAEERAS
jgi:hypothetical protein